MRGLVADANFEGQLNRLVQLLVTSDWAAPWAELRIEVTTFRALGLAHDMDDRTVWARCQAEQLVLVTVNRNHDSEDSLEAAIRGGGPFDLPVFTVSDGDRVLRDTGFARAVAIDMLDHLVDLRYDPDKLLGSGRLYLPKTPY